MNAKIKLKIVNDNKWLRAEKTHIKIFELENHYILKYVQHSLLNEAIIYQYMIYNRDGNRFDNCSYENFEKCLLNISLNLKGNDTIIGDFLFNSNRKEN